MREKSRAEIRIAEEFPFMCRDNPKASSRHAGNGFEFHEGWESTGKKYSEIIREYFSGEN